MKMTPSSWLALAFGRSELAALFLTQAPPILDELGGDAPARTMGEGGAMRLGVELLIGCAERPLVTRENPGGHFIGMPGFVYSRLRAHGCGVAGA